MKYVASVITASLFSAAAMADESWQYQGEIAHVSAKQSNAPNIEMSAIGTGIGYYFAPLPTTGSYPLAEAPFAERVGNVTLSYVVGDIASDFLDKADVSGIDAGVTVIHPNSNFALHIGYNSTAFKEAGIKNTSAKVKIDSDSLSVGVGYFLDKYLLMAIDHEKESTDYTYQPSSIPSDSSDTITNQLFVQYLTEMGNGSFISGVGTIANKESSSPGNPTDSNRIISLHATYYPNKMHGLSMELGQNRGDNQGEEGYWYEVGYQGFVSKSLSLSASYNKFSINDSLQGSDDRTITVGLSVRF